MNSAKWYQNSVFILILTFLVFPLGFFLMRRYKSYWYDIFRLRISCIGLACFMLEVGSAAFIIYQHTHMVWIDDTSSHYHSSRICSNMDYPYKVTPVEAIFAGYSPCSKCIDD